MKSPIPVPATSIASCCPNPPLQITPAEVEEICNGDFVTFEGNNRRAIIIGVTRARRALAVILDRQPEENVYFPVTARTASPKERRYY